MKVRVTLDFDRADRALIAYLIDRTGLAGHDDLVTFARVAVDDKLRLGFARLESEITLDGSE